ncbi:acyloxyacyl hydrolase [Desulforhopalus sp. 52FAK]
MALQIEFNHKSTPATIYQNIGCRTIAGLFVLGIILSFSSFEARCADVVGLETAQDNWAVIGGYGQSIPGWGETSQRVETVDLIPRYNHHLIDNIGSSWYRGYHSLLLELPLSITTSPDVSSMVGANFLAAYTFTADQVWQPYLFGGGGPVYSFADIPEMGAELNGNYQFGIGLKHSLDELHKLLFEVRYHHISNAGTKEPNDPLNSAKILIGVTF